MRQKPWLSSLIELSLVVAAALCSVVAFGQETKKPAEGKPVPPAVNPAPPANPLPPAKSAPTAQAFEIVLPEPGAPLPPPAHGPRPSEYWIGLECYPASGALSAQLGLPEGEGLVVEGVATEGPSAKAGLKRHDILLTSGATKLHRLEDLGKLVAEAKEKPIEFKVLRAGKQVTVSVQPAKRPFQGPPEGAAQVEQRLHERLGQPGGPFRFRFFHPGVVVHVGDGSLPGDVSVNVNKDPNGQTHVEVRRGDQNWTVKTDGELPGTIRGLVGELLGGVLQPHAPAPAPQRVGPDGKPLAEAPPAVVPGVPVSPPAVQGPIPPAVQPPGPGPANPRLEERLEAMQRHMEAIHKELNELRNRQAPPPNPAPPQQPKPTSDF